jgi:LmbE family N-acetylglucosaminyl deacetylase
MRPGTARPVSIVLVAICAARGAAWVAAATPPTAPPPQIDARTSLLVVAPHPDDETLCCGGLIQRVVAAGGQASVVWITSGDASELDLLLIEKSLFAKPQKLRALGAQRMREAHAAAAVLGVPDAGQLFLGYPDRGLLALLGANRLQPYTSGFTGAAAVPYAAALYAGHPYTGESLERDFAAVLERVRPTLVLAPSPLDTHPDHRAAGLLAITVSSRSGLLPRLRFWIVHGGEGWPSPRGLLAGVPLTPAPRGRGVPFGSFALEPAEEDRKLEALRAYRSQMQVMAPFLLAFVRTTELFAAEPGPPAAR